MRNKFRRLIRLIIGLLVGGLLMCPISAGSVFPDVDDSAPYAEAVEFLNSTGIMQGSVSGNFNPNSTVTRAEMATILCNVLGETDDIVQTGGIFTDVPEEHWASGYIAKAASLGLVTGYGNGYFGINDKVIYEQAITMIVQALGKGEAATLAGGYPKGYVSVADEGGYLDGVSANEGEQMTRSQISIMFYNVLMGGNGQ